MANTYWLYGLVNSGKTTLAKEVIQTLKGIVLLDGNDLRDTVNKDIDGFGEAARYEQHRRAAEIAKILNDQGIDVICALITPTTDIRNNIKEILGDRVSFIRCACDYDICASRDQKGLYEKAATGEISSFTGLTSPFDPSNDEHVDCWIDTTRTIKSCVDQLTHFILRR